MNNKKRKNWDFSKVRVENKRRKFSSQTEKVLKRTTMFFSREK